eukprot:TRINITY_DN1352_c0_g1_i1.p3 TRINITY_DN1352_c0_g1~~TRINITY_DN1352_c0_g1_i1.p3  ORF type:complete len:201 (-),score=1.84 TRINITY_DN1352_c0_g1_i1:157-759(-)
MRRPISITRRFSLLVAGKAVKGSIGEGSEHDNNRAGPGRDEPPADGAAKNMALQIRDTQIQDQNLVCISQQHSRKRNDLELSMEKRRLHRHEALLVEERDVADGAGGAHHTHAHVAGPREGPYALADVAARAHFQDVRSDDFPVSFSVLDQKRLLWLVLGAPRAPPWSLRRLRRRIGRVSLGVASVAPTNVIIGGGMQHH